MNHREYVGDSPWDLISHHVFDVLVKEGLREHHHLLDIGAGSFRIGRLLIPWLGEGCYDYYEPNHEIEDIGIEQEIGCDLATVRDIRWVGGLSLRSYDYILAHSIFIHSGLDILTGWLDLIRDHLRVTGRALVTIRMGPDHKEDGWRYPGTLTWSFETFAELARERGLHAEIADYDHPKHTWVRLTHAA